MVDTNYLGIFRGLNGVGFLKVDKVFPGRGAVLPLAASLPADGQVLKIDPAIGADYFLVCKSDCHGETTAVVDDLIQQNILVPIRVTLGEDRFCNQDSGELSLVTIVKIDDVGACVKDWVGFG